MKARLPQTIPGNVYLSAKGPKAKSSDRVTMTLGELEQIISGMFDEKYEEVYESVRVDITSQMLALVLYSKIIHDGYAEKRLLREIENLKMVFKMMSEGVLGKTFDPTDVRTHLKEKYNIDVEKIIKGELE